MSAEAKSSKGVRMFLSKGDATVATVNPSAIDKGNPTAVTAPPPGPVPDAYAVGQLVYCRDTGFAELDNKYFSIAEVTVDGFTLRGADTTDSEGVLRPNAEMDVLDGADLIGMCLNNFAFNLETPGTIAAGTYCNPSATLPSTATGAGTATLGGWIDVADPAYVELIKAEDDGLKRVFSILLPLGQGEIIAPLTVSGIAWDIPLEGGMAFTATAALGARPRHLF
jgi:hypothetical protein